MLFKMGDILEDVIYEMNHEDIIMSPEEYDLYHGTDFWYCGIRCDVTFKSCKEKGNTVGLGSIKTDLMPVHIGVRTGNAYEKFDYPVCVISFDALLVKGNRAKELIASILTEELLDEAITLFWDGCDRHHIDIPDYDEAWSCLYPLHHKEVI